MVTSLAFRNFKVLRETTLHPRLLRDIQDALYRLSYPENSRESRDPVQVVLTTHSPYFVDLYRDHPDEVVIANKRETGTESPAVHEEHTQVRRLRHRPPKP